MTKVLGLPLICMCEVYCCWLMTQIVRVKSQANLIVVASSSLCWKYCQMYGFGDPQNSLSRKWTNTFTKQKAGVNFCSLSNQHSTAESPGEYCECRIGMGKLLFEHLANGISCTISSNRGHASRFLVLLQMKLSHAPIPHDLPFSLHQAHLGTPEPFPLSCTHSILSTSSSMLRHAEKNVSW